MTQLDATATPAQGEPAGAPFESTEASLDAQLEQAYQAAMAEVDDAPAQDPQADEAGAPSEEPAPPPDGAQEPDATEQLLANDPEFANLSRSQRGKLLESMRAKASEAEANALKAQEEATALRERAEQQQARLHELAPKVEGFIGSAEHFEDLEARAIDGDWNAAAEYKELKQRREMLPILDAMAFGKIALHLEDVAKEKAGMEPAEVRASKSFDAALTAVIARIEKRLEEKYEGQVREAKAQLDAEKAAHDGTRLRATGGRPAPETGGASPSTSPLGPYIDPKTGFPSDDAIEAALQGRLAGLNLTS